MLDNLRQDLCRIGSYSTIHPENVGLFKILFEAAKNAGFRAVFLYRIGHWCRIHKLGVAAAVIERLMHHLCHCWISTVVDVGSGFVIPHVCGIIVDGAVGPIGKNCSIRQNVTVGGNYGKSRDGRVQPLIGDNVSISPGAQVLGPITIGSNTVIGANAVVTTDIPENSVVGTFRSEILAKTDDDGNIIRDGERVFLSRRQLYERIKALEEKIEHLEKGS
jgi:serine O-acetyltransferase